MAKFALLIGISAYVADFAPLPSAVQDATAMQQVLQHPALGGFAASDVTLLHNPDRQSMEDAIEHLFAERQKDDLVLLFFSGHGIKDDSGNLYLATHTTRKHSRGELVRSSAVAASFIRDSMRRSRSKRQVVILDSCFSGAFAEGLSAKDDGTVNIREQLGGEGGAVLTSSSATQYSFDEKGEDLSIYTRYLIEGITTGGADLDDDGVVSIDELHEYARTKVHERQPAMKPEIYAIREGFKIHLTKVPPGDPTQKYRTEVKRYLSRGEVSFIGRKTLDAQRSRFGLSAEDAMAIEDELLKDARQEFQAKLQHYERDFVEALQQDVALSEDDLNTLRQNLQHILGLRFEDTRPLEDRVRARLASKAQGRQQYEQALADAMRQEYPPSPATRQRLQQQQQQWQLSEEDIAPIEHRIAAEMETYHHNQAYQQKLQQYEQVLTQAMQTEYPLGEETREELRRFQSVLELGDDDVTVMEAKIVSQKAAGHPSTQSEIKGPSGSPSRDTSPIASSSAPHMALERSFTNSIGMEFILIPAGTFMMGSPDADAEAYADDKPAHHVTISQPFYLGKYPVTQAQWATVMGNNPSFNKGFLFFKGNTNRPVERVYWGDVQEFMRKLNEWEGGGDYYLPTEAQWEYACRAGTETPRYYEDVDAIAWYKDNSNGHTHPVGQKLPNAWGLYDMLGNVWEWCHDGQRTYTTHSVVDPIGSIDAGAHRVIRGGSWCDSARLVWTASRDGLHPGLRSDTLGFRLASAGPSR